MGKYWKTIRKNIFNRINLFNLTLITLVTYIGISVYLAYLYSIYNGISMGKDGNIQFLMPYDKFIDSISVWEDDVANGIPSLFGFARLSISIYGILFGSSLGGFLYYFFLFFISLIGTHHLAIYFLKKIVNIEKSLIINRQYFYIDLLGFLSSLFFVTHPTTVSYKLCDTAFGTMIAYFTFPFFAYILLQILENLFISMKKSLFYISIFFIFSFLYMPALFALHITILLFLFVLLLYITLNFRFIKHNYKEFVKRLLLLLIIFTLLYLPLIILVCCSSLAILSSVTHGEPPLKYLFAAYKKIPVFSIISAYPAHLWEGLEKYNFFFKNIIILLLYISIFSFSILNVIYIKNKKLIVLLLIYLLFVTFALWPKVALLKFVFIPLFNKIFVLWLYRVAYIKIVIIQIFILIFFFIYSFYILTKNRPRFMLVSMIVLIIIFLTFFIPILYKQNVRYHSKIQLKEFPYNELYELKNIINQNKNGSCKILAYPPIYGGWIWSKFGYYGYDYLPFILIGNHITSSMESKNFLRELYFSLAEKPLNISKVKRKINLLGISCILYRKDINITEQRKRYMGKYLLNIISNWHIFKNSLHLFLIYRSRYYEVYYIPNSTGPIYSFNKNLTIQYKRFSPNLWKVYVKASRPFLLTFAESYDPLWEARVYKDGKLVKKVRSIPVYGVINGFWINQTGNLTIIIRYVPQDWFELGLKISATTFTILLVYLIVPERYWRKLFEKLKSKIRLWQEKGY